MALAPRCWSSSLLRRTTQSIAESQSVSTSSPLARTSGVDSRSSELLACQPNRPLASSRPWFTRSQARPRTPTIRPALTAISSPSHWNAAQKPTAPSDQRYWRSLRRPGTRPPGAATVGRGRKASWRPTALRSGPCARRSPIATTRRSAGKTEAEPLLQALCRRNYFCAHVAVHHRQRGVAELGVDVRDGIRGHHDRKVAHVGIQRGIENALLGDLAGENHPFRLELPQQVRQPSGIERAVAHFG